MRLWTELLCFGAVIFASSDRRVVRSVYTDKLVIKITGIFLYFHSFDFKILQTVFEKKYDL